jgi:hypothetical protein
MEVLSLKIKIEGPEVLGRVDLSNIDSSTKPKGLTKRQSDKAIVLRERLDSGWGWSFRQLVKNYNRSKGKPDLQTT